MTTCPSSEYLQQDRVAGWGEGSKDLHSFVSTLAEQRVLTRSLARGSHGSNRELGLIVGQIRRTLSLTFIRAQSLCLLARMCHMGKGAKEAAGRRDKARRVECWRRKEMQSHFMAHIREQGLGRKSDIFVP